VILTPQAMTEATATAEALRPYAQSTSKPILASWMGGPDVAEGEAILDRANIPTFAYPDTAVRAFTYLWKYTEALAGLYETPSLPHADVEGAPDRATARALLASVRASGRTLLTEAESKELLAAYRIPVVETHVAQSRAEAARWAAKIGFPVVLKLHSEVITHKTDVGGVQLNLQTPDEVSAAYDLIEKNVNEKAGPTTPSGQKTFLGVTVQPMVPQGGYEIILGSSVDPQFGPVLLFGSGGQLVEVLKDRALALPPLNTTLARRMMEQTRIYVALQGVRGRRAVDLPALEQLLVSFSHLIVEQPWIRELDINPLLASPERLVALDARVVLHPVDLAPAQLPRPAIRPYPMEYVGDWTARDGATYRMRPIRPEDEPLLVNFHRMLSERSVFMRYARPLEYQERIAHERLSRICFVDYDRELALVAETRTPGAPAIVGVARLIKDSGTASADFNILVVDDFQKKGIGTELLRRIVQIAHDEKYTHVTSSDVLPENAEILRIADRLGFRASKLADGRVRLVLRVSTPG
jgi:acetyltransferase